MNITSTTTTAATTTSTPETPEAVMVVLVEDWELSAVSLAVVSFCGLLTLLFAAALGAVLWRKQGEVSRMQMRLESAGLGSGAGSGQDLEWDDTLVPVEGESSESLTSPSSGSLYSAGAVPASSSMHARSTGRRRRQRRGQYSPQLSGGAQLDDSDYAAELDME